MLLQEDRDGTIVEIHTVAEGRDRKEELEQRIADIEQQIAMSKDDTDLAKWRTSASWALHHTRKNHREVCSWIRKEVDRLVLRDGSDELSRHDLLSQAHFALRRLGGHLRETDQQAKELLDLTGPILKRIRTYLEVNGSESA